jgi:hypothetical protein
MTSSYKSFCKTVFIIWKALLMYGDNLLDLLQIHLLGFLCITPTGRCLLDVSSFCSEDAGVRLWEERKETYVQEHSAGRQQKGRNKLERYLNIQTMTSKERSLNFHPHTQI